jgi:hypothetical protein
LAEAVKKARNLDDCHFWVIAPQGNTNLWNNHKEKVEDNLYDIMTMEGKKRFKKIQLEIIIDILTGVGLTNMHRKWLAAFRDKYLFSREF